MLGKTLSLSISLCADNTQLSICPSFSYVECCNTEWNERFLRSFTVFHASKKCLYVNENKQSFSCFSKLHFDTGIA